MSSPLNSPCAPSPRRTDRGSAVITVLVLAAVTAVIASGFLFRSTMEAKLATRSLYQSVALNLAEAGIEEGLYAVNTVSFTSGNGWTLASGSSTDYVKTITSGFNFQQATGAIYIRVDGALSTTPTVTAAGLVSIPQQRSVVKQVRVGSTARRLWTNAMAAKGIITFSGNANVDSYDSSVGLWNSATNRTDRATVGTTSTALDPIELSSRSQVYGYVATAGSAPDTNNGGRIYGATTPENVDVDPARVRLDFSANLPDVTAPTGTAISLGALTHDLTLPRTGDTPGANGRYLYTATSIDYNSRDDLQINGNVDLIVTGNVRVRGDGIMTVGDATHTDVSLAIYTPGNVTLEDTGGRNHHKYPVKMSLYGTAPTSSSQTIAIAHREEFYGIIYAPNAAVQLRSGGDVFGAVIGKTITLSNRSIVHYDVQLANATSPADTMRLSSWTELTAAPGSGSAFVRDNRAPFTSIF